MKPIRNRHLERPVWILGLGVCLVLLRPASGGSGEEAEEPSGWQLLQRGVFKDALESFVPADEASGSWNDFGRAMALMNANPVTATRVREAEAVLSRLSAEQPNTELSVAALYMLGRIAEWHVDPPQYDRAIALYTEVIESSPGSVLSGEALINRAILSFFRPDQDLGDPESLYRDLLATAGLIGDRDQERRLELLLAEACRFHDLGVDRVLFHLKAALATDSGDRMGRARLRFQIAGTALEAGDRELAADQYRAFLAEFPRDDRTFMVRGLLRQVEERSEDAR